MQALLKSFASLFLVLLLLGGSALIGVWRSRHGGHAARPAETAAPLADPVSPADTPPAAGPRATAAETVIPRVDPLNVFALPRASLDLKSDLRLVQRAVRRGGRFTPAELTALATLLDAEQKLRTPELLTAVQQVVDDFHDAARERITPDFLPAALQFANLIGKDVGRFKHAEALLAAIDRARDREEKLASAEAVLAAPSASARRLERALADFREVLEFDPGDPRALRGLERIERRHLDRALATAADGDFARAEQILVQAAAVRGESGELSKAQAQIRAARLKAESEWLSTFESQLATVELGAAAATLERLRQLPVAPERVAELAQRLEQTRLYGTFQPGASFSDGLQNGGNGPRMRVLPVGEFVMGSPEQEADRRPSEGPQRRLRLTRGLAFAQAETTVMEFRSFVDATAYVTDAERLGSSTAYQERSGRIQRTRGANWRRNFMGEAARDKSPVVHVSFNDARAYAAWLSAQTGAVYRLPTEAEFEYAIRAGSSTTYWWGDATPTEALENVTGSEDSSRSNRRWNVAFAGYGDGYWGPAPVRSFKPNPFGLFDMAGNVSEWVEDCWHDSYLRAPENLQAWVNAGCDLRVVRGGSWGSPPTEVRSAFRLGVVAENRGGRVGFRVVREL